MKNVKTGLEREAQYRTTFGGISAIRKTPYTCRQIDIFREQEKYMGQLKTGKLCLTEQVKLDLKKDVFFVNKKYIVEYFLEKGASKSVLDAMDKYGIKYVIGKKIQ